MNPNLDFLNMKPSYKELEREHDKLVKAVKAFIKAENKFANEAFVSTIISYGNERPRAWRSALLKMQKMIP